MSKQVITVADVNKAVESGLTTLEVCSKKCIITPGAMDKIEELGIQLADSSGESLPLQGQSCSGGAAGTPGSCSKSDQNIDATDIQEVADHVFSLLRDQLPDTSPTELKALVGQVVDSKLSCFTAMKTLQQSSTLTVHGPVSLISGDKVFEGIAGPDIPGKVEISDKIRCHADSTHFTTYMQWQQASLNRVLEAPEINLVIEGKLELTVDGKTLQAQAGDVLFMNTGADVTYSTPSRVKLACINV